MRARTFMQVSIGILALALAYHFGASSAGAQGAGYPIVAMVINPGGAPPQVARSWQRTVTSTPRTIGPHGT